MSRLTENHIRVLTALDMAGDLFIGFGRISEDGEIDRKLVRRTVRHLARAGLAQYARGLTTEDGEMAGAGYAITEAGRAALRDPLPSPTPGPRAGAMEG